MHDSKATEIMRTVHEYIKTVGAGAGSAGQQTLNIELDPNGHPIALSPSSWDKITKGNLEILYRTYMTLQYRMNPFHHRFAGVLILFKIRSCFRHQQPASSIFSHK